MNTVYRMGDKTQLVRNICCPSVLRCPNQRGGRQLARHWTRALGLAAVEVAEGRTARAVEIAAVAEALSKRAGVVITHPMAPELAERIDALKASIPRGELDGLVAAANTLTPAAVLAMVGE